MNGVLRVIDLNRQMLRLGPKEDEIKVKVPDGMVIVDEIAGLEDKPVVVTGVWRGRVLHLRDIEADVHPGVGSDA